MNTNHEKISKVDNAQKNHLQLFELRKEVKYNYRNILENAHNITLGHYKTLLISIGINQEEWENILLSTKKKLDEKFLSEYFSNNLLQPIGKNMFNAFESIIECNILSFEQIKQFRKLIGIK